jgi:phage regulator Rha-like protein
MLDSDLAVLYGVQTKRLNEAVRRNSSRFPEDFMFRLEWEEVVRSRSQIATLKIAARGSNRKYRPMAFTEHGVAMLSSVLRTTRAVRVNIEIVRAFVRLRRSLAASPDLERRMRDVENKLAEHDVALGEHTAALHEVFEDLRALMGPPEGPKGRIGFRGA